MLRLDMAKYFVSTRSSEVANITAKYATDRVLFYFWHDRIFSFFNRIKLWKSFRRIKKAFNDSCRMEHKYDKLPHNIDHKNFQVYQLVGRLTDVIKRYQASSIFKHWFFSGNFIFISNNSLYWIFVSKYHKLKLPKPKIMLNVELKRFNICISTFLANFVHFISYNSEKMYLHILEFPFI